MARRRIALTDEIHSYVIAHGSTPDEVATDLIEETAKALPEESGMQVAPDQAGFLTWLTRLIGVRHAVEVGTFTGYSALAIARGLADGGRLICCDVSRQYTDVARRYWQRAGVDDRIDLRIAPAAETLAAMPGEPHIDLAFIDADKTGYPRYWSEIVPRMRSGGVIVVDNVLRGGRVLDPPPGDDDALAVAAFNEVVLRDDRVEAMMLPLADGITLARRR